MNLLLWRNLSQHLNLFQLETFFPSRFQGIFGTLFNRANIIICRLRKTTKLGKFPVREVLLVTLVTALLSFPLPYMRMNMGDLIRLMVSRCGPGDVGALW